MAKSKPPVASLIMVACLGAVNVKSVSVALLFW
ncbi:hypothetical protein PMI16_04714 [Herbaspirillum sp. CF444]|nr:hypothetical protein PMI16_04714 [Herbaspirillum sp. CF444]